MAPRDSNRALAYVPADEHRPESSAPGVGETPADRRAEADRRFAAAQARALASAANRRVLTALAKR